MTEERDIKKADEGFSLIEILLAIVILAIVSLGIMALMPNGYKQITTAGRTATLDHVAQKQLDYLRSIPVTHTDLTAGTHTTTLTLPKYFVHWIVEDYTPLTNAKSVKVIVGYDTYQSDGTTVKSSSEAIDQESLTFPTLITQ